MTSGPPRAAVIKKTADQLLESGQPARAALLGVCASLAGPVPHAWANGRDWTGYLAGGQPRALRRPCLTARSRETGDRP